MNASLAFKTTIVGIALVLLYYFSVRKPAGEQVPAPDTLAHVKAPRRDTLRPQGQLDVPYKGRLLFFDHGSKNKNKKRILLTGDSMGDGLYLAWRQKRKQGHYDLRYVPWYGSITKDWGATEKLKQLIADYRPSLVVFSLGSNELFIPKIDERATYVKEIVEQMGQTEYVWVGPPNWKDDTGINDLIAKHTGPQRFFVSKYLRFERRRDGAHPTNEAAAFWADTISRWIDNSPHYRFMFFKDRGGPADSLSAAQPVQ